MSEIKTPVGTITVSGPVGIGKSLILATIVEALKKELDIEIDLQLSLANQLPERIYQWEVDRARKTKWTLREICTPTEISVPTCNALPTVGELNKIYVTSDTGTKYIWLGERYSLFWDPADI